MKQITLGILILFSCLACGHRGEKTYLLRLKYNKGDTFILKYQNYATLENSPYVPINEVMKMKFRVDSVIGDSLYVLSSKFVYIKYRKQDEMNDEIYSSEDSMTHISPAGKQAHESLKPFLQSSYTLMINSRGQVIKPFESVGQIAPSLRVPPFDYESCQIIFPEQPVAVGEEWTDVRIVKPVGVKRTAYYKIENIKDSVIEIDVQGKQELTPDSYKKDKLWGHYSIDEKTKKLNSAKIGMEARFFLRGKGKFTADIEALN